MSNNQDNSIEITLKEERENGNPLICPKNYFIGMMDILGFKNLIEKHNGCLEKIYTTLYSDFQDLPEFLKTGSADFFCSYKTPGGSVVTPVTQDIKTIIESMTIFSDTILFYIESTGNDDEAIRKLLAMCNVMNSFIVLPNLNPHNQRHQLALRGAIAYGRCVMDKSRNIYFGKPIIDAYELEEAQQWMGGALHPSVFTRIELIKLEKRDLIGFDAPIYHYPVPIKEEYKMKNRESVEFALNWVQSHPAGTDWFPDIPITRPIYRDLIENNFMVYDWGTDEKSLSKKENTLVFARHIFTHYNRINSRYYWDKQ